MKDKKLNKMQLIKIDQHQAEQYKQKAEEKIRLFEELLTYVGQFVTVDNRSLFYNAPTAEFKRLFKTKTRKYNEIPLSKVYELFGVNIDRITNLSQRIQAIDVNISAETLEAEKLDHGIYAETTQELALLETAKARLLLVENTIPIHTIKPDLFALASNGLLIWNGQGFEVNSNTIKGIALRY